MINSKEAIEKAFARIHAEAEERRAMERAMYTDYKNGLTPNQISSKYHVVDDYVDGVIKLEEKADWDKMVQGSLLEEEE